MWDLSEKRIESLQIGDKVKTLDLKSGKLIDTDVIMIMDTSDIQGFFNLLNYYVFSYLI